MSSRARTRRLAPGVSGAPGATPAAAEPSAAAHRGQRPRGYWTRERVLPIHEAYLARGIFAAASEFGLTTNYVYQLLYRHQLTGRATGERSGEESPTAAAERAAVPGVDQVIHEGEHRPSGPRTQIGRITMPCSNCGELIEQTIVLRPAGSRR